MIHINRTTIRLALGLALGVSTFAAPSVGLADDVPFSGTIASSCSLGVPTSGVFGSEQSNKVLNSAAAGGTSGSITAVTTGAGYSVTIDGPTDFSSTVGTVGDTTAEFATTVTADAGIGSIVEGVAQLLGIGTTTMTIDLKATSTNADQTFPAGVYNAIVTVTCA